MEIKCSIFFLQTAEYLSLQSEAYSIYPIILHYHSFKDVFQYNQVLEMLKMEKKYTSAYRGY